MTHVVENSGSEDRAVIAVSIATGYGLDSRQGREIFLNFTESRPTLGPTKPPIQYVPGALSPGLMRPEYKADHSLPNSAQVMNSGDTSPLPHTSS
jgi:hypothetical protein